MTDSEIINELKEIKRMVRDLHLITIPPRGKTVYAKQNLTKVRKEIEVDKAVYESGSVERKKKDAIS